MPSLGTKRAGSVRGLEALSRCVRLVVSSVATVSRRAPFLFSAVILRFSRPVEQRASDTAEVVSDAPSVRVPVRSHGSSEKRSGAVAPSDALFRKRRNERSDEKTMSFTTVFIGVGFTARLS